MREFVPALVGASAAAVCALVAWVVLAALPVTGGVVPVGVLIAGLVGGAFAGRAAWARPGSGRR